VLSFEIRADGGVTIVGTETELRMLAHWILRAALVGSVVPTFVADEGLTSLVIMREDDND
jgi:hypothetical protein